MYSKEQWLDLHEDLMKRLGLPCELRFSKRGRGRHKVQGKKCFIEVNSDVDWQRPEHLILHEAAHHIHYERDCSCSTAPFLTMQDLSGHCEHWARVLTGVYVKTGYALPEGTQFENFAKVAGILHREYKPQPKVEVDE